jgi:hypothetical protein
MIVPAITFRILSPAVPVNDRFTGLPGISQFCELVTFVVAWPVADRSASGQLVAFVEEFVEEFVRRSDRGARTTVLTDKPVEGQLAPKTSTAQRARIYAVPRYEARSVTATAPTQGSRHRHPSVRDLQPLAANSQICDLATFAVAVVSADFAPVGQLAFCQGWQLCVKNALSLGWITTT